MQSIGSKEDSAFSASMQPSDFDAECVVFFEEIVQIVGVQRSVGQIYGILFASAIPLSFTDIVRRLGISKGSASQGLQLLRTLGAVRRVSAKRDRREFFEPELGLRKLVSGVLRDRVEPIVSGGDVRLRNIRECAARIVDPAAKTSCLLRVKQLETWRRQMRILLPVLKTMLGPVRS